jgi:glycerol-1-phosphate dehydrogenase [NAD(P)+]
MFYNLIKTPAVVRTGNNILSRLDEFLLESHLFFQDKTLVTQKNLYGLYQETLEKCKFDKLVFVEGGTIDEFSYVKNECVNKDTLMVAFGGGSVLDIVKYCASNMDIPYITIPSTLSNDAIYSCVSRLTCDGKKRSFGVNPPVGIIVDLEIIRKSPNILLLAGVADLISNLSATQDWSLAHDKTGESINEIAFMLAKESVCSIFDYEENDIHSDNFLLDLANGLITSGLSMIISGNTRGTSGAEHLISHAIDEYFPEKSTIHGLQVGWAHLLIEKKFRNNYFNYSRLNTFYTKIGLSRLFKEFIPWNDDDIEFLIPYAKKIRTRYTIFNTI